MKQVLQDLKSGEVILADVPEPAPEPGRLLVRVQASLLSAGTESAQLARGRESLLTKVRHKPELVRQGMKELRDRGLSGLRDRLASKREGYAELGYSCAGSLIETDRDCPGLAPGSLVACAGIGFANHAEFVSVPRLLTAAVPAGVSAEAAAFTTVGAIALQGVRQSTAQLGEYVAVIGLGLVGLLTAQLLRASGCRVLGIDPSAKARERGLRSGCDAATEPETACEAIANLSSGLGADAVIICAATSDNSPVVLAGKIARSRGRVIMVGATGMEIPREEYYRKELSFTLSRSYGPGRYDPHYEELGRDYPVDYVRFTEERNMRAFLELVAQGRIDVSTVITHRFPLEKATAAYAVLSDSTADRVGIVLQYSSAPAAPERFVIQVSPAKPLTETAVGIGFIGAGAYAQSTLLPLLKGRQDVALRCVMTRDGAHSLQAARRFGFETVCSQAEEVLQNSAVQAVFIATRHDSHARLASQALRAGKHVWVEKPLALSLEELKEVFQILRKHPDARLMVGFNRPFSPGANWLFAKLGLTSASHAAAHVPPHSAASSRFMLYRVNAGYVPKESWIHDPSIGGGRLIGEGCHFFDFLRSAAGSAPEVVYTESLGPGRGDLQPTGNFAATVRFQNGSVGQLLYTSSGAPAMGKEHFECFTGQTCGVVEDFKTATFFHGEQQENFSGRQQDKGQAGLVETFLRSLREGSPPPISPHDLLDSSLLTLAAQQSLVSRQPVKLADLQKLFL